MNENNRLPACFGVVSSALVAFSLSAQDGCFAPDACEDLNDNGVVDACENVDSLGTGLLGSYYGSCSGPRYGGVTPSARILTRVDADIDFRDDPDFPPAEVPADGFFVRWTGAITSGESGVHRFRARHDDGFRCSVNGQWIIEDWVDQSGGEYHAGEIELTAGVPALVVIEFYENSGSDFCELEWRTPSMDEHEIVPTDVFSPSTDLDGDGYPDFDVEDCDGDGISDAVALGSGLSRDCDLNCVPDECDESEPEVLAWYRFESNPLLIIDSSGNDRHLIASPEVFFSSDRFSNEIPRTGVANFGSVEFPDDGQLRFPDPDGVFALGDESFTVEAWLKVNAATTENSDQRQYLLQKKSATGDVNAGFQILAQCGNIAAAGDWYGKSSNRGGNEIGIRFGNGTSAYTMISRIQLVDCAGWVHMSVAVDQENQRVRFEVDGVVEWQDLPGLGHVPGQGALRIGAHSTSAGDLDQHFDGKLDELRIIRGVLPLSGMLDRSTEVEDCPENPCDGDYDDSGSVDGADLTQLLGGWGTVDVLLDLDGAPGIDGADLTILLGNWGVCP